MNTEEFSYVLQTALTAYWVELSRLVSSGNGGFSQPVSVPNRLEIAESSDHFVGTFTGATDFHQKPSILIEKS